MPRMRHAWILVLAVALPYLAGLTHGFVYDDHGSIEENHYLATRANLPAVLTLRTLLDPTIPDGRRPVVLATYFVDRALFGLRPAGWHATNLLLHLAAALLLYSLVRALWPEARPLFALGSALLFGLHPALTEAVQLPAFREDLLVTVFVLLHLRLAFARGWAVWLAPLALVLAMLSKESAAIAPILLALAWWLARTARPGARRGVALLAADLAIVAAFAAVWIRVGIGQGLGADPGPYALPFPQNLWTAPALWLKALRVLAWPYPLLADYTIRPVMSPLSGAFLAGKLAALIAFAAVILLRWRSPAAAFGLGWLIAAFLPVSNVIPLFNPFAERYLYLPAAGFAIALAAWITARRESRRTGSPGLRIALGAICMVYLCLGTARVLDWTSDERIWGTVLAREPDNPRALTWRGLLLKRDGRIDEAVDCFERADRANPRDVNALINLAVIEGERGALASSEKLLREAVRRRPGKADAHWNLAVALEQQGRTNEAAAEVQAALKIDPRFGK